jgi:hypothetical protein
MSSLRAMAGAALLCLLLVVPSAAIAQDAPVATGPDPTVLQVIESQVADLRGLLPQSEVNLHVLDQAGLHQYLVDAFERDYLPAEREADQKLFIALGLLKPTDDLVQIQLQLLEGQVIGVYDPDDKVMFVVDNQGGFGPAERITYAHEFNHALQDQYYDLNQVAPKHPLSNDRSLAAHAVVEGDAVLLQSLWAAANLTQDELLAVARGSSGGDDSLSRAPLVVRTELLFPYIEGLAFVRKAFRDAGNSFAGVDELLRNPPESTAQILHADRHAAGWRPLDVPLPDVTQTLGSDWRRVGSGVLGELDVRVLLEQYGDRGEASRVAAGWAGDRWLLVDKDGRTTIVLKTTWQSETAAGAFFSAYKRGLRARFSAAATEEDSEVRQALTGPVVATDLRLQGSDVQAVIAFDRATANAVIAALPAFGL